MMKNKYIWLIGGLVLALIAFLVYERLAVSWGLNMSLLGKSDGNVATEERPKRGLTDRVFGSGFSFDEDTPGYENYVKLESGGPGKDGIPSIDNPKFDDGGWLVDGDVVFVVEGENERKVYPQRILNWHEIVNDEIEGEPIVVSFCPLCGSAIGFESTLEGKVFDFGVSGLLFNSNLVMYDRQTDSLWQQIGGESITGEMFGKKLIQIVVDTVRWSQVERGDGKEVKVLSQDTGFVRNYDRYPYGGYEEDRSVFFPLENEDGRLHEKAVVYGVVIEDEAMAFVEEDLPEEFGLRVGGVSVTGTFENGQLRLIRRDTGELVPAERDFWFAWVAFYPETSVFPE